MGIGQVLAKYQLSMINPQADIPIKIRCIGRLRRCLLVKTRRTIPKFPAIDNNAENLGARARTMLFVGDEEGIIID